MMHTRRIMAAGSVLLALVAAASDTAAAQDARPRTPVRSATARPTRVPEADALLPWLPLLLERSSGQLTRHVAMLLPHGFSRSEGIRFAPESLELWITHRLFRLDAWTQEAGVPCRQKLSQMAAVLGFDLEPSFWEAPGLRQRPC